MLAGDALLTHAFGILADPETHPSGEVRAELVARLAAAGGAEGMIGGQMMDMRAPEEAFGEAEIILLQRMKTGALFEFSCEAGAILGGGRRRRSARGCATTPATSASRSRSPTTSLTPQVRPEQAGKAVGKDQEQGKATLVSLHGRGRRARMGRASGRSGRAWPGHIRRGGGRLARPSIIFARQSVLGDGSIKSGDSSCMASTTPLLDTVRTPADLKAPLARPASSGRGRAARRDGGRLCRSPAAIWARGWAWSS